MLRHWDVGLLGHREHFVSGAYLRKYLSDCLQILQTTPPGGVVVPFGVLYYMRFDLLLVQNYDLFRRFDAH